MIRPRADPVEDRLFNCGPKAYVVNALNDASTVGSRIATALEFEAALSERRVFGYDGAVVVRSYIGEGKCVSYITAHFGSEEFHRALMAMKGSISDRLYGSLDRHHTIAREQYLHVIHLKETVAKAVGKQQIRPQQATASA